MKAPKAHMRSLRSGSLSRERERAGVRVHPAVRVAPIASCIPLTLFLSPWARESGPTASQGPS